MEAGAVTLLWPHDDRSTPEPAAKPSSDMRERQCLELPRMQLQKWGCIRGSVHASETGAFQSDMESTWPCGLFNLASVEASNDPLQRGLGLGRNIEMKPG